jgi:uncharacterized protein YndB with AHSA1/START domain
MTHASSSAVAPEAERSLSSEYVFEAPLALVFQAWTDPRHLPRWYGPSGFSCETRAIEVREGGVWEFTMNGPDGTAYSNVMRFLEITAPERLVYDHGDSLDGAPHFRVSVSFEDLGVRTRMRKTMVFPTVEACEAVKGSGAVEMGYQTLDKLAAHLAGYTLRITRTLDAPREVVYRAWSEPEALGQWWGPKEATLEVVSLDFRAGGHFHYRMAGPHGTMWGRFDYLETTAPERIVWINAFADAEGRVVPMPFLPVFPKGVYNVVTFTELDGKTLMELGGGALEATDAEREAYGALHDSMQQGFGGTLDQLEAYLAK